MLVGKALAVARLTPMHYSQPAMKRRQILSAGSLLLSSWLPAACKDSKPQLPTLGKVPAFELTDQEGATFGSKQLQGQIWVAAFMFTRCPSICPRITRVMVELQQRAKQRGLEMHWVSFSVDPENDRPPVLKAFAKEHGSDLANWSYLTGPLKAIRDTAEQGFKLALEGKPTEGAEHMGITHGSHLVLVDERLNIRGYYRTLDDHAQKQLLDDVEGL